MGFENDGIMATKTERSMGWRKADKRASVENLVTEAEHAASREKQGMLYKITKMICGKNSETNDAPIMDK